MTEDTLPYTTQMKGYKHKTDKRYSEEHRMNISKGKKGKASPGSFTKGSEGLKKAQEGRKKWHENPENKKKFKEKCSKSALKRWNKVKASVIIQEGI